MKKGLNMGIAIALSMAMTMGLCGCAGEMAAENVDATSNIEMFERAGEINLQPDNHNLMFSFKETANGDTKIDYDFYYDGTVQIHKRLLDKQEHVFTVSESEFKLITDFMQGVRREISLEEDTGKLLAICTYYDENGDDLGQYRFEATDREIVSNFDASVIEMKNTAIAAEEEKKAQEAAKEDLQNDPAEAASTEDTASESKYKDLTGIDKEYYDKLAAAVTEEIAFFLCDDYDADGNKEAFAVVKTSDDSWYDEGVEGNVYFVDSDEVTILTENIDILWGTLELILTEDPYGNTYQMGETVTKDAPMFFAPSFIAAATAVNNLVFGVRDGKPYETNISIVGASVAIGDGQVILTKDCYDHNSDGAGHTWKPYYYHYNSETGMFDEYVGREITEEQLLTYEGAQQILDSIRADGNIINNIIERDNGIININYSDGDPAAANSEYIVFFDNVTLKVNGSSVVMLKADYRLKTETTNYKESSYGGTYYINY
jgi:hypothetical protein